MATKMQKVCDVFATAKLVDTIEVTVTSAPPSETIQGFDVKFVARADMCPRAVRRLIRLIERGMRPPCLQKGVSSDAQAV